MITLSLVLALQAGDLVTYRGDCLRVHSIGVGPISLPYVHAVSVADPRRTWRLLATDITPGCAP